MSKDLWWFSADLWLLGFTSLFTNLRLFSLFLTSFGMLGDFPSFHPKISWDIPSFRLLGFREIFRRSAVPHLRPVFLQTTVALFRKSYTFCIEAFVCFLHRLCRDFHLFLHQCGLASLSSLVFRFMFRLIAPSLVFAPHAFKCSCWSTSLETVLIDLNAIVWLSSAMWSQKSNTRACI